MCLNDSNRCGVRNSLKRWAILCLSSKINCRHLSHCTSLTATIILVFLIVFGSGCTSEGGPSDFIEDQIGLLSAKQKRWMERLYLMLLNNLDIHIKTEVLADSPMDLNQATTSLFQKSQLGIKARGARGVLIVVDLSREQVRVEIGYDLEGMYPDAFCWCCRA